MGQMVGTFAPAGELALTAAAMFGSSAPSPVGLGKDQGAAINGLQRDAGGIGSGIGDAGIPSLTGGSSPSMNASPSDMPNRGAGAMLDVSHPAPWILVLGLGLLGLIHFNVGGSGAVRVGR